MRKRISFVIFIVLVILMILVSSIASSSPLHNTPLLQQALTSPEVERLQQDAVGNVEITWNARTGNPSFIRGHVPISAMGLAQTASPETIALAFIDRYAGLFGVRNMTQELNVMRVEIDDLGMSYVNFSQVYQGVDVYNAYIKIHLSANREEVVAASSNFMPDISSLTTKPNISAAQAITAAQIAMPNGILIDSPKLVVYPGFDTVLGAVVKLTWVVEMWDDAIPAWNIYFVDANDSYILHVLENLQEERNRETYDANEGHSLPGTLVRSEGDPPISDSDVDNAHDFAGDTYDYFFSTHNRDSYDDAGATLISTANYGVGFRNAFWNGSQMVYGDGFAVNDVAAHELTHAVTEYSANLEYSWQPGALNESFSDIFGTMVDRDDWLIGEDLPPEALGGQEAIRDLSDPPRFGQPDHTDDWVATCSDNEGVHTNSGIANKAYYNVATTVGKDKAELIFYRTLTVYLSTNSSLEDARAAAIQSAQDLYGGGSAEENAVRNGFNAVGLDGNWNPPANDCTCAATTTLADETVFSNRMTSLQIAATLYRLRDQFSSTNAMQYYRPLYEQHTERISSLLLKNSDLRARGGQILQMVTPGLTTLMDGKGNEEIVTEEMVNDITTFLEALAAEDRANGNGDLADTIEQEMARIDWDHLVGMTFDEAFEYLNAQVGIFFLYLPTVMR